MFDFASNPVAGSFDQGEYNQDKASSQLNLANLILVDLVYLIKNAAVLETKVKYGGVQPSVFVPFFTAFREIFDLTSHLIDGGVSNEIENWFENVDLKNAKSLNDDISNGLKLARQLKMEIVKLGMLKIFEPPIQPPFMLDDTIAKAEKEQGIEHIPTVKPEHKLDSKNQPVKRTSGKIPGVKTRHARL